MWSVISLGVITIFLRLSAIRWWRIPADDPYLDASITPSLRGGDLVLLWRMTPPSLGSLALCPEPKHPERVVIGRMMGEERNNVKIEGSRVLINDRPPSVNVILDAALVDNDRINCHPLTNTATTTIGTADLLAFIRAGGHEPRILPLDQAEGRNRL